MIMGAPPAQQWASGGWARAVRTLRRGLRWALSWPLWPDTGEPRPSRFTQGHHSAPAGKRSGFLCLFHWLPENAGLPGCVSHKWLGFAKENLYFTLFLVCCLYFFQRRSTRRYTGLIPVSRFRNYYLGAQGVVSDVEDWSGSARQASYLIICFTPKLVSCLGQEFLFSHVKKRTTPHFKSP